MNCENSISVFPKSIALKVKDWSFDAFANVYCTDYSCSNVTWHSEDPSIASVNSVTGYICANGVGTTRIYATLTYGTSEQLSDYLTVTVTKRIFVESVALNTNSITIEKCKNTSLLATVLPANATKTDVYWESSNTDVATVTNGTVTGISTGTAIITVKAADDLEKRASCVVTVTDKILVSSINITTGNNVVDNTITAKKAAYLYATISPENATKKSVTWSSSNKNIATINSNSGLLSAQAPGTTIIRATAKDGSGVVGTYQITVLAIPVKSVCVCPKNKTIGLNETAKFYAVISPVEASNQSAIWTSSDTSVATVTTYTGIVTGVSDGTATITATTVDGEKTDSSTVTVDTREKVTVKKDSHSFYVEFADGKIWKNIGIDLSNRKENYNNIDPPDMIYENYNNLIKEEQRYLNNIYSDANMTIINNSYSEKQIAFLYLLDPFGIEYYMKHHACYNMDVGEMLFFKDRVYKEIFGVWPRLIKIFPDKVIKYYVYSPSISADARENYYTDAEILFGEHQIYDLLSVIAFALDVLPSVALNLFSIFYPPANAVLGGIELIKFLFFSASVSGVLSHGTNDIMDEYTKTIYEISGKDNAIAKSRKTMTWAMFVLDSFSTIADASEVFTPSTNDIITYNHINESNYRVNYVVSNSAFSMADIISRIS